MTDYYPAGPFRRFLYVRGRLQVAETVSAFPGEPGMVFDEALIRKHMESWERAGEPDLSVDTDKYVKGFLYNDEPSLVATIRAESSMDERAEAKNALHEWSAGEGLALSFDFTFEELPA